MRGGFSFCGVDIADLGIEYAPENKDTYVYRPSKSNVYEETFDGHNGGYFFGASKQPKEFVLRCYYEDKHMAKGLMARIYDLFRVGQSGKLIFSQRPWCYYYATVTDFDDSTVYNYMNGLFVITMKAYYPYARACNVTNDNTEDAAYRHLFYNKVTDPCHTEIMQNTAVLEREEMISALSFENPASSSILLYNPGTERAKVSLVIKGQVGNEAGDGITIHNRTTNQTCKYVAFNTEGNEYIYTDGINGKTIIDQDGIQRLAFLYHDHGFIELEPSFPIVRNIFVSYTNNTVNVMNVLYCTEEEKDWYIGKYIYLGSEDNNNVLQGNWRKIVSIPDKHTIIVSGNSGEGSLKTDVVLMNELQITLQNTTISKLAFIYKPTFA